MTRGPEGRFKDRIRTKILERGVFCESAYSPYSTGRPDQFYEGCLNDLYIEYKWLPGKYAGLTALNLDTSKLLSAKQAAWIERRRNNGKEAWVVVGFIGGRCVIEKQYRLRHPVYSESMLINEIVQFTGATR